MISSMHKLKHGVLALLVLLASLSVVPAASAATSADATIFNKATLTYSGGTVTAGVSVSVALVGAAPTLSAPADDSVASGGTVQYTYTITNNSNGRDTFNLTSGSVEATDSGTLGVPGLSFLQGASGSVSITNVNLGAAITGAVNAVDNVLLIPAGSESNLSTSSVVIVGGNPYTVDSITAGTVPDLNNTEVLTQVTLLPGSSPTLTAGSVAAGTQFGERVTFRLSVTGGTITGTPTVATHTVTTTATSVADGTKTATNDTVTTVAAVNVFMTKKVALYDPGQPVTNQTYVTSGLSAKTGGVLIYQIEVGPSAGQPDITTASITDAVPDFTEYVTDSLTLNGVQVSTIRGSSDGGTSPLIAGFAVCSQGDAGDDGTCEDGVGKTGVIRSNNTAVVTFRVTVK
jgi:uncharacterized repeat protein (TIGR01451 family)